MKAFVTIIVASGLWACSSGGSSGGPLPDGGTDGSAGSSGGSAGSSGGSAGSSGGSAGAGATGGSAGSGASGGSGGSGGAGALSGNFGSAEVLVANQTASFRIAMRGGTVFWQSRGAPYSTTSGSLQSIAQAGGTPKLLMSGDIRAVVTTVNSVLWADATTTSIYTAGLDGSAQTPITNVAEEVGDIAVAGGNLYWTSALTTGAPFRRIPLAGGTPSDVVPAGSSKFAYLAADESDVYAVGFPSGGGVQLFHLPLTGGTGGLFANLANITPPAINAAHLYIASSSGLLRFVRKPGSSSVLIAPVASAFAVALDADAAYVTARAVSCSVADGIVVRVPLDTQIPTTLATGQACPSGIAVDASGVYWVNTGVAQPGNGNITSGSGQVMRARRL